MKTIDNLIPIAIDAIVASEIPEGPDKTVPNEYKGYIDSFGSVIVQNGLIPAVVFFENSGGKDSASGGQVAENRKKLMSSILKVTGQANHKTLYDYITVSMPKKDIKFLRDEIVRAAIAVKLALRTFKFSESESDNG